MEPLTTQTLARACRIFMELAYPEGADTIPATKRAYYDMAVDRPVEEFLALNVCQDLSKQKGSLRGYELRLGSAKYPHLKLRVQILVHHHRDIWVYSVDTHDGFQQITRSQIATEAEAWRSLVEHNRDLKHQIEEALAQAHFLTPKNLLQLDLATPTPKPS